MPDLKTIDHVFAFLLTVIIVFCTVDFPARELPGDPYHSIPKEQSGLSAKPSRWNSCSAINLTRVLKKAIVNNNPCDTIESEKPASRFINMQWFRFLMLSLWLFFTSVILLLQKKHSIITFRKEYVSVLALSLGGNSPPILNA